MGMQRFTFLVFGLPLAILAKNELGTIESAQQNYPDAFAPGKVLEVDHDGKSWYAFAGEAEQCFSGKYAESETELFDEATLDAKSNFLSILSHGDSKAKVTMSGLRIAYQYADGAFRRVVCMVPVDSVSVSHNIETQHVSLVPTLQKASVETKEQESDNATAESDSMEDKSVANTTKESVREVKLKKCREQIRQNPKSFMLSTLTSISISVSIASISRINLPARFS